ncbi:alpha/beta hydrolase [Ruegeria sp.]|uniref:alpha/beta hydrolase n=1 Tax=Ruegeria sp. TaxID=1879320 RepID=UPI002321B6C7|nr:alpha/beta hydrolase [Ruegeria sp.]MDA7966484.1 alpha/beta hydrolase [Ruegeria sp.]
MDFKLWTLTALVVLGACAQYDDLSVHRAENSLVVTGVIDAETEYFLREAAAANPGAKQLVLHDIPGSVDDENSLVGLSRFVRDSNLTTVVPATGMVASGGTDLALMGRNRIIEPGACVGVHTWAAGGLFGFETGAELPRDDPAHQLYLQFYRDMGIDEEFYWFTLEAAGADTIYWMSEDEINRFDLSTIPVKGSPAETAAQRDQRCSARLG